MKYQVWFLFLIFFSNLVDEIITLLDLGRVRLFDTPNTRVTVALLRDVYHLASYTGTSGVARTVQLSQARLYHSTLVLSVLNKRTRPIKTAPSSFIFYFELLCLRLFTLVA